MNKKYIAICSATLLIEDWDELLVKQLIDEICEGYEKEIETKFNSYRDGTDVKFVVEIFSDNESVPIMRFVENILNYSCLKLKTRTLEYKKND